MLIVLLWTNGKDNIEKKIVIIRITRYKLIKDMN